MTKTLLWLNFLILVGAVTGAWYIINNVDPTNTNSIIPWIFVGTIVLSLWSIFTYISYSVRLLFPHNRNRKNNTLVIIRSQRQGFLLALLVGLHLILQGFLLWNIFSGIVLVGVIFVLELFFMSQEST